MKNFVLLVMVIMLVGCGDEDTPVVTVTPKDTFTAATVATGNWIKDTTVLYSNQIDIVINNNDWRGFRVLPPQSWVDSGSVLFFYMSKAIVYSSGTVHIPICLEYEYKELDTIGVY